MELGFIESRNSNEAVDVGFGLLSLYRKAGLVIFASVWVVKLAIDTPIIINPSECLLNGVAIIFRSGGGRGGEPTTGHWPEYEWGDVHANNSFGGNRSSSSSSKNSKHLT